MEVRGQAVGAQTCWQVDCWWGANESTPPSERNKSRQITLPARWLESVTPSLPRCCLMLLGQQFRNSQSALLGGRDRSLGVRPLRGVGGELAMAALPAQAQHGGSHRKGCVRAFAVLLSAATWGPGEFQHLCWALTAIFGEGGLVFCRQRLPDSAHSLWEWL